ncbi:MAG: CDP-alcohol phosphatidyltransferase family protein [Candidatus Krumholzibacteria bacterium]|nr:CDP-alcohol phosphatidyltransferase family protein [Candidatus Krumholzibacteria bacterium]MDH4338671.1 CDP-alcohol phosphatidyltransferase family protein [Candidatus Krumholzibacteria bacterium]MDH5271354.1 CDP-alcohol phosphatidyltransferase family protein [Candidatus Krumholzibacteria bacterium]
MTARITVPNVLTMSRMVMALAAALLAIAHAPQAAVGILIAAALLDAFDGWYARAFSQSTALGAHLDPLADKVLMGVVFVWVGVESRSPWVWGLVALVALRETAVTLLRAYSLRRHGRFIPASRFGRIKMLTQSIVGLTLLSVMHFLGREVPVVVTVTGLVGILIVSYASGVGYLSVWRSGGLGMGRPVSPGEQAPEEPRRVSAGRRAG